MRADRRIPDNLGGTHYVLTQAPLVGNVEFKDAFILLVPPVALFFATRTILDNATLTFIPSIALGLVLLLLLILKPSHLSLLESIKSYKSFKQRPKELKKYVADGGFNPTESGTKISSDKDTREKVYVDEIFPEQNVAKRKDGAVFGAIKLTGANLDSATPEQLNRYVQQYVAYLNELDESIQLYLPMKKVDATNEIQQLEDRKDDPEIQSSRLLQAYVNDRKDWVEESARQAYMREYYVILKTTQVDVLSEELYKKSAWANNLKRQGRLGRMIANFYVSIVGGRGLLEKGEILERQVQDQKEKLAKHKDSLAGATGGSAEIVSSDDLAALLSEAWEGRRIRAEERENFIRNKPFVTGKVDQQMLEDKERDWNNSNKRKLDEVKNS